MVFDVKLVIPILLLFGKAFDASELCLGIICHGRDSHTVLVLACINAQGISS